MTIEACRLASGSGDHTDCPRCLGTGFEPAVAQSTAWERQQARERWEASHWFGLDILLILSIGSSLISLSLLALFAYFLGAFQ